MKYEKMNDRTHRVVFDSFGSLDRSAALCGGKGSFELRNFRRLRDGSLARRGGLMPLVTLPGDIRGGTTILREGVNEHYAVAGSGVYVLSEQENGIQTVKIGDLTTEEGRVEFASYDGALLLLDGEELWMLTPTEMTPIEAYVPLYGKDWSTSDESTHVVYESPNLLSRRLRVQYILSTASKNISLRTLVPETIDAMLIDGEKYTGSIGYLSTANIVSISKEIPAGAMVEIYLSMPFDFISQRADVLCCHHMADIGQAEQARMIFYGGKEAASMYVSRVVDEQQRRTVKNVVENACMLYVSEHDKITVGDGVHAITGACRHYDRSLIFTARGCWMAGGEERADGTLDLIPVNTTLGCSNAGAISTLGNDPITVFGHRVLRWNSQTDELNECNASSISMPVETLLPADFGREAAVCRDDFNQEIWFYRPGKQARIFVFQAACDGWTSFDGFAPKCVFGFMGSVGIGIGQTLYCLSEGVTADTLISEEHPEGARVGIDAEFAGSFADFGLAERSKRLCAAEIVACCGDQTVQLTLQNVNGRRKSFALRGDGKEISVIRRRVSVGRFRFVRVGIRTNHDGPMRLYAIRISARSEQ